MATIDKRKIKLLLVLDKDDPTNFASQVTVQGYVADDSEVGGAKRLTVQEVDFVPIPRAQFRNLTGSQIESSVAGRATDLLQAHGDGAGSHTINDDSGD